mmetsp:Transcript_18087/g.35500  ORF Transcript_18087/g.35500 Transcript_18087/m.35500 type:complete len:245 (-) Transcript_18087:197-931(-)
MGRDQTTSQPGSHDVTTDISRKRRKASGADSFTLNDVNQAQPLARASEGRYLATRPLVMALNEGKRLHLPPSSILAKSRRCASRPPNASISTTSVGIGSKANGRCCVMLFTACVCQSWTFLVPKPPTAKGISVRAPRTTTQVTQPAAAAPPTATAPPPRITRPTEGASHIRTLFLLVAELFRWITAFAIESWASLILCSAASSDARCCSTRSPAITATSFMLAKAWPTSRTRNLRLCSSSSSSN